MNSVILDVGIAESILADVKDFIGNPQWYMDRGKFVGSMVNAVAIPGWFYFIRHSLQKRVFTVWTTWLWKE